MKEKVLIIHDGEKIQAWLVGEPPESLKDHIRNGYPHLADAHVSGALKVEVIEIDEKEKFRSESYSLTT